MTCVPKKICTGLAVLFAMIFAAGRGESFAEKPLLGIFGITSDSPRCQMMAVVLAKNLEDAVTAAGVFDKVNSQSITDQLLKFNCLDEHCFLPFASRAKIGLVLTGNIADREKQVRLTLTAYGTDVPFYGKIIVTYTADIALHKSYGSAEFDYLFHEHSRRFISEVLKQYKAPLPVKDLNTKGSFSGTGTFPIFRKIPGPEGGPFDLKEIGSVTFKEGKAEIGKNATGLHDDDIALVGFADRVDLLETLSYERKREIVLERGSPADLAYAIALTIPVSATMPLLAPTVGYFMNSDWTGLMLWTINAPPYIYLEISGLLNRPHQYRHDRRDIPRDVHTRYRFGLYMLFAGGLSLMADAASHAYLSRAADYLEMQPLIGNNFMAAYFSLVSGGGGHFYKGYRLWGYFYFHLNNLLMYFTMREFSQSERYNYATNSYFKSDINRTRAYALAGAFAFVKIIEVIHVLLLRDRIWNGDVSIDTYSVEPVLRPAGTGVALGLQGSLRF